MGFRAKLTSATAVDTGDTAGVRINSNPGNPGAGYVQWYVGDVTATAELGSSQTGSGGSSWGVGLSSSGGRLGLSQDPLPAGGYTPAADLDAGAQGAPLYVHGTLRTERDGTPGGDIRGALVTPAGFLPGWAQWTADLSYQQLTFHRHPDGWITVEGLMVYAGGPGAGANVANLLNAYVPSAAAGTVLLEGVDGANARYRFAVYAGATPRLALHSSTFPTAGSYVSLSGRYRGRDW